VLEPGALLDAELSASENDAGIDVGILLRDDQESESTFADRVDRAVRRFEGYGYRLVHARFVLSDVNAALNARATLARVLLTHLTLGLVDGSGVEPELVLGHTPSSSEPLREQTWSLLEELMDHQGSPVRIRALLDHAEMPALEATSRVAA
jgi:hypothetical protein